MGAVGHHLDVVGEWHVVARHENVRFDPGGCGLRHCLLMARRAYADLAIADEECQQKPSLCRSEVQTTFAD